MLACRGVLHATFCQTTKLLLVNATHSRFERYAGKKSGKPPDKPTARPNVIPCKPSKLPGKASKLPGKESKSADKSSKPSDKCKSSDKSDKSKDKSSAVAIKPPGLATDMISKLFKPIAKPPSGGGRKVTIVGAGQVGMAIAFSILAKGISNEVCLVDASKERTRGEMLDLQHGSLFLNNAKITASHDFAASANSRICVVTAGARQKQGESRLALLQRNADILKSIIPQLIKHSPKTILLLVTNPVDIMAYVTLKVSKFPPNRVIGSGTTLDSARFRYFISQRLGVAPSSCHGYIIGEHGDSSVPVWSGVSVSGVNLYEHNEDIGTESDKQKWGVVHQQVVKAAYEVIALKGYTSWAIGLSAAALVSAMLDNSHEVYAVSTAVKGFQKIKQDIFLSLPCILCGDGISSIVQQTLCPNELELLHKSAEITAKVQASIKL